MSIKGQRVYKAIEKYGWENIKKEILYIFDNKQEALNKEHEVIDEMRLLDSDKGYNDVPAEVNLLMDCNMYQNKVIKICKLMEND